MILSENLMREMETEGVRFLMTGSVPSDEKHVFDYAVYHFLISGMQVNIHVEETENILRIFTHLSMHQHHPRISSRFYNVMDLIQQAYKEIIEQEPGLRLKYVTGEYEIQVVGNKS